MLERERNTQGVMPSSGIKAIGSTDAGRAPTKAVHVDATPPVDQQAQRAGGLVLVVAWWYEHIEGPVACEVSHWFEVVCRHCWPAHAWGVSNFVESLVRNLLGDFIAWPIAEDHLRAKWNAELAEQNRQYHAARRGQA